VQAFIIAFYAEMYGFPVTIYLLARIFNLDVAGNFWDGNLWVYLTGAPEAMLVSMAIGYTIVLFGVLLLIAGWREIYRAKQQGRLATGGPYALVRHPQYTGIFLALFGEGVVHWPTVFSLAAFPIIVIAYTRLARKEERQMIEKFGDEYREYRRRTPMFLPHLGDWRRLLGSYWLSASYRRQQ
jgi:protein-S-isoprenylcysteine O-methyltransferase Ste14